MTTAGPIQTHGPGPSPPSALAAAHEDMPSRYEPAPLPSLARLSWYPWLVVGTTCIGAFVGQLDASIVQLAMPAFERQFDAPLSAVSWVAIAYLLAFAGCLPAFARLCEIFGRKLLYLGGFALFTIASACCALVSDLPLLIAFRIVQGIGGALLGANSIIILLHGAGASRRGRAMGIFAAAQAVGVSAGPVIGGLLLASLGWRWVFLVSVPFGLAGIVIGWLVVPQTTGLAQDRRFDWLGALLLTPAVTAIVVILSELYAWGPTSPATLGCAATAAVLLTAFWWWETRAKAPLIDLHLFRARAFSGGLIAVGLSFALLYAMFFLMSFAFVRGFHDAPIAAGLRLAVIPVALGLTAPISGVLYERVGARIPTTLGMALCLAALVMLFLMLVAGALPGGGGDRVGTMVALALFGIGLGLFMAPNNSATVAAAPESRRGEAGGMLNLMRVLGGTLGIATASTALSWQLDISAGAGGRTLSVPAETLLGAVSDVLLLLGAFAIAAAGLALLRGNRAPAAGRTEPLDRNDVGSRGD